MGCDIHIVVQINKKKGFGWETVEEIPKSFTKRCYLTFAWLADVRNYFSNESFKPKGYPVDFVPAKCHFIDYSEELEERYKETVEMVHLPDGRIMEPDDEMFLVRCGDEKEAKSHPYYKIIDQEAYYYDWKPCGGVFEDTPISSIMSIDEYAEGIYERTEDGRYGEYMDDFGSEDYHTQSWLTLSELKSENAPDYAVNSVKVPYDFKEMFESFGGKFPEGIKFVDVDYSKVHFADAIAYAQGYASMEVVLQWPMTEKQKKESCIYNGIQEMCDIAEKYGVGDDDIRMVFAFDN